MLLAVRGQGVWQRTWFPIAFAPAAVRARQPLAVDTNCSYNLPCSPGTKRLANLRKHRIDFLDAAKILQGLTLMAEDKREAYGEQRFLTLGLLKDQVVSVTHAERG